MPEIAAKCNKKERGAEKETGIKTQSISENVSQFDIQIAGINHIVALPRCEGENIETNETDCFIRRYDWYGPTHTHVWLP